MQNGLLPTLGSTEPHSGIARLGVDPAHAHKALSCISIARNNRSANCFHKNWSTTDVRSFFEDRNGLMWISSSNGIYQIDRTSKKIVKHIDIPENLVRDVIKDTQGRIMGRNYWRRSLPYSQDLKLIHTFDTYAGFPSIPSTTYMKTPDITYGLPQVTAWYVFPRKAWIIKNTNAPKDLTTPTSEP